MNLVAVAKALDRAEKRILARARKAWKLIRESTLEQVKSGILSLFDISELAKAFKVGMISAYIFGRAAAQGQWTRAIAIKKEPVQKQEPTDEIWVSYWRGIWATDRTLLKSLMFLHERKRVNPMDYYFRPSQAALDFLNGYTVQLAHVIEQDLLRDVTSWIRDTIEQGMSEREALKYLQAKIKKFGERRLRMVARTEATRAFNIGTIEEAQSSEVVVGYKFDAVLDKNTTDICRARNGKFIPKADTELLIQNTPPLHVNCRSRLVPITKYDELPKNHMPDTFEDEKERARQRPYDVAVLRQVVTRGVGSLSRSVRELEADEWIERIKEAVGEVRITGAPYTVEEIEEIYRALDWKHDPPPIKTSASLDSSYYDFKTDRIGIVYRNALTSAQATIHESLHRIRFLATGNTIPLEVEEATNDIVVKWLLLKQQGITSPLQGYIFSDWRVMHALGGRFRRPSEGIEVLLRWRLTNGTREGLEGIISIERLADSGGMDIEDYWRAVLEWGTTGQRRRVLEQRIRNRMEIIAQREIADKFRNEFVENQCQQLSKFIDELRDDTILISSETPQVKVILESILEMALEFDEFP